MTTCLIIASTLLILCRINGSGAKPVNGCPKRSDFPWSRSNRWWLS